MRHFKDRMSYFIPDGLSSFIVTLSEKDQLDYSFIVKDTKELKDQEGIYIGLCCKDWHLHSYRRIWVEFCFIQKTNLCLDTTDHKLIILSWNARFDIGQKG